MKLDEFMHKLIKETNGKLYSDIEVRVLDMKKSLEVGGPYEIDIRDVAFDVNSDRLYIEVNLKDAE